MIISYSNDFVFIRIPKCASTTCVVGLYDMGFVDELKGDMCTGIEKSGDVGIPESHRNPINWPDPGHEAILKLLDNDIVTFYNTSNNALAYRQHVWHSPYHKVVESGLIEEGMPCVSTIRHPVDRFISITAYVDAAPNKETINDPNIAWDGFKNNEMVFDMWSDMFKHPQSYYVSDDAQLWNVENVYDWLDKFAIEKNVIYNRPYHYKNNKMNQTIQLTENRKQEIVDRFEDDYLLWEKSYRVFN